MALENGVLVHGPSYWACAVRTADGEVKLASGRKPLRSGEAPPLLRGPLKLAEVFALLPVVRRELPEARLPHERPAVLAALGGTALTVRGLRASGLNPVVQEALAAVLAIAPAAASLRGSALAEYHGAEHISIGTHEDDSRRASRVHERCGSHLIGPLAVTSAAGSVLARIAPPHVRVLARTGAALGALAASVELFPWMVRNDDHPLARALARPGQELQDRLLTAEPTSDQLAVANAALRECVRLESGADGGSAASEGPPPYEREYRVRPST